MMDICKAALPSEQEDMRQQKYLRLLTYPKACRVIDFINKKAMGYAYITPGGVSMQVSDNNWDKVEKFIKSLKARYEIGTEAPYVVEEKIKSNLKIKGVIK